MSLGPPNRPAPDEPPASPDRAESEGTDTPAPTVAEVIANEVAAARRRATAPTLAARRLGEALRLATERLIRTSAPDDVVERAIGLVESVAEELGRYGRQPRIARSDERHGHGDEFYEWSPLLGRSNPVAPPISIRIEEGVVVGQVRFGAMHEGPPGFLHGGLVAAAFDEIMGVAQILSGQMGLTGRLTVRYRRPTPLHVDLRLEARVAEVSGRKVLLAACLLDGETVLAEAEGLFVSVPGNRFPVNPAAH